jgi:hypothetical protein
VDIGNVCHPCLIRLPPAKPPLKNVGSNGLAMIRLRR